MPESAAAGDIRSEWSRFFRGQVETSRRFGPVWRLPLVDRHTDLLIPRLRQGLAVLEIGAADRRILEKIAPADRMIDYRSLDPDPAFRHDYARIEDLDRSFDMIWMFEVIEHLDLEAGRRLVEAAGRRLRPGGLLIMTTPNGHHPHRFREPHHGTAYKFDSLGALALFCGLAIESIHRVEGGSVVQKFLHRNLFAWLHRFLDIDFARTIALVASKPERPEREG